jgi:hypothetical protein
MNEGIRNIIYENENENDNKKILCGNLEKFKMRTIKRLFGKVAQPFGFPENDNSRILLKKEMVGYLCIVKKIVQKAKNAISENAECPLCLQRVQPAKLFITNCCHIFCIDCFYCNFVIYNKSECAICRSILNRGCEIAKMTEDKNVLPAFEVGELPSPSTSELDITEESSEAAFEFATFYQSIIYNISCLSFILMCGNYYYGYMVRLSNRNISVIFLCEYFVFVGLHLTLALVAAIGYKIIISSRRRFYG